MAWSVSADNWFWATPLVRDGVVYAASLDGKVYAVSEDSGEARWDQPFDTGSPVRSSPTFAGGGLLVASRDGDVYKLDVQTGQPIDGSPGVTDQTVEADLTSDQKDRVYVVPRSATLFIVDAAGTVAVTSFALPQ
jgi:outer membrane protein assembly factor BamB